MYSFITSLSSLKWDSFWEILNEPFKKQTFQTKNQVKVGYKLGIEDKVIKTKFVCEFNISNSNTGDFYELIVFERNAEIPAILPEGSTVFLFNKIETELFNSNTIEGYEWWEEDNLLITNLSSEGVSFRSFTNKERNGLINNLKELGWIVSDA